MKKFTPIVAIALFAIGFTSCTKEYTCQCTDSAGATRDIVIPKTTKSLAETSCSVSGITGETCKLK